MCTIRMCTHLQSRVHAFTWLHVYTRAHTHALIAHIHTHAHMCSPRTCTLTHTYLRAHAMHTHLFSWERFPCLWISKENPWHFPAAGAEVLAFSVSRGAVFCASHPSPTAVAYSAGSLDLSASAEQPTLPPFIGWCPVSFHLSLATHKGPSLQEKPIISKPAAQSHLLFLGLLLVT